ncbi:SDR family NAD(P)-dependent oxidoreductase [Planctomicrobium sp. SH664]|uniref:SDR family NAD(P)-dependent oxidoreductase n=1 Tax=Planctomicrobium sp. SH664 TaxID=3448125 RepID=UPI003F5B2571
MASLTKKLLVGVGIAAGAALAARSIVRQSRWISLEGKTVLLTGGSRGLGLVMARQLVDAGARVALCARTEADLDVAAAELRERGGDVFAIPCDVSDQSQVQRMVEEVLKAFSQIDILINCAGIIQVGPLEAMTTQDFEKIMRVNCWGPLHTTLAVLPRMRERGTGRIVNVSSFGGKLAMPHLLPYVVSKFALIGLSQGMRAELLKDGILVTTAIPGLMRTGSPRNAQFKGQHRKEYAWFSIGDSLPGISMPAEEAATQILQACQAGSREVLVRQPWNVMMLAQQLAPGLVQEFANLSDRLLPAMGGIGQETALGYQSESVWSPSLLTTLTEQAAAENNELRPISP